jgi:hypothetical protein
MVAYSCVSVYRVTIRLQFARIAEWQGPIVHVHLISPWRAHLGDHAGHCIHHHRQQATDYLFAELPGFKKPSILNMLRAVTQPPRQTDGSPARDWRSRQGVLRSGRRFLPGAWSGADVHAFSLAAEQVEDLNGRAVVDWVERGRAAPPREPRRLRCPDWSAGSGITAVMPRVRRCRRIARDEVGLVASDAVGASTSSDFFCGGVEWRRARS